MRAIGRGILAAIFLALTALLAACGRWLPPAVMALYPRFSQGILAKIGAVTGAFPFALWEALAAILILWAVYTLVRVLRRGLGFVTWLAGLALGISIGLFLFVALWGLNHYAPTVDQRMGLSLRGYSVQELKEAAAYYGARASLLADQAVRGADGSVDPSSFSDLADQAAKGYSVLARQYDCFTDQLSRPKKLASWYLFSHFGVTGIFIPFTAESCVNPDTFSVSIPYTMCHELAHRQAVAAEDEANFCAFLACAENPSLEFQYSGFYSAFIYCYNALKKADPQAASDVWAGLSQNLTQDCHRANVHYAQYEGKVQDAAQKVNDTYLKAFSQEAGVQSYGQAADLLIGWYLQNFAQGA